jgi:twinkle protein
MNALDEIVARFPNRFGEVDLSDYQDETYTPRVKSAGEFSAMLLERIGNGNEQFGARFGIPQVDQMIRFRPGEITIWTGFKGHGKSAAIGQGMNSFMADGQKVFVISPEFHPVEVLFRAMVQYLGTETPERKQFSAWMDWVAGCMWLYDVQASLKSHDVVALCRWVMDKIKPDHILIDSLMKVGIGAGDYDRQKSFVDQIQSVAHSHPVHIHLVAHGRKGGEAGDDSPARIHDVKGASEIVDMAENVVSFFRNKRKEKAASMGDSSRVSEPDAIFTVEAQRNCGGAIGSVPLLFDRRTMNFLAMDK